MMPEEVTVEAALKRGVRLLKVAPVTVIFTGMGLSVFVLPFVGIPGWLVAACLIGSFVAGWLTWSILATHWRIWSLTHVRNAHALFDAAVNEKLIWPAGSWLERTEIRTAEQRAMLEALGVRLHTPDVWKDDPDVPDFTEIRWSRKERVVTSVIVLLVAGLGGYMILQNVRDIWGWGLLITVAVFGIIDIRKLSDSSVQLRLDDQGITMLNKSCITWHEITSEGVVMKGSGDSTYTALEFWHPDGRVEVKIDQMDLPKKELRHRLRVYRFRSGAHSGAMS